LTPNLWIIIPPPVLHEWGEHSQRTFNELQQHLYKLDTMNEFLDATAHAVSIPLPSTVTYSHRNIDLALAKLSRDLLNHAIILREDSICQEKAYRRVVDKVAPADNKGGMKDCMIIEHSIELCSQLRKGGFAKKCVFISSNTKYFCLPSSTAPKPPLDSQLNAVQLFLTTNWQWARHELGL
jgi:hypothetical protein